MNRGTEGFPRVHRTGTHPNYILPYFRRWPSRAGPSLFLVRTSDLAPYSCYPDPRTSATLPPVPSPPTPYSRGPKNVLLLAFNRVVNVAHVHAYCTTFFHVHGENVLRS
jgi:hypothetical protein